MQVHTYICIYINLYIYSALQSWYGGGPRILRKVIESTQGRYVETSTKSIIIHDELELYPLRLIVCSCDDLGNIGDRQRDLLFSKVYVCIFFLYVRYFLYVYMYGYVCICLN
jgi:hypothetical protein